MEKTHIFFDLETTGLGKDCDIVQIATVHENGKTFNRYIIPEADIGEGATKVNQFYIRDSFSTHFDQNVIWLEISVNYLSFLKSVQNFSHMSNKVF